MIERTLDIVLTLIVFIIVAFLFIEYFGYPTCLSAANQTAFQLKLAIDEVASDDFPGYYPTNPKFEEPTDPFYYTTVPIRLCQEHTEYAFQLQFIGGMPEYQIYYERFPEGGGGMWTEAYPWSGGKGAALLFWGLLRGATFIAPKLAKMTIGRLYYGWKATKFTAQTAGISKQRVIHFLKWLTQRKEFNEQIQEAIEPFIKNGRLIEPLVEQLGKKDAKYMLKYLGDAGIIETVWDESTQTLKFWAVGRQLVLKDADVPVKVYETVYDSMYDAYIEKVQEFAIYQPGHKGVLDPAKADWSKVKIFDPLKETETLANKGLNPDDWIRPTINPREQMEYVYNALKDKEPRRAAEILDQFVIEKVPAGKKSLKEKVTDPNFIRKIQDGVKDRITRFKDFLKRNLYGISTTDGKYTMQTGEEVFKRTLALENLALGDEGDLIKISTDYFPQSEWITVGETREYLMRKLLEREDLGFTDKIRYYGSLFGIPVEPEIKPETAAKVLRRLWDENGGGLAFYHNSDLTNVFVRLKDAIIEGYTVDGLTGIDDIMKKVRTLDDYTNLFGPYEKGITRIATDLRDEYADILGKGLTQEIVNDQFANQLEEYMLANLVRELKRVDSDFYESTPAVKEIIERQYGMLMGIFDKNYDVMPVSWKRGTAAKYVEIELKRMIFVDGTSFVAPNSWVGKGLILTQMTEECKGNSMCLYIHASQYESPYYLSEETSRYTVRLWRPIEWWKQVAGLQAAMQRVPSHPRFYIVSPCFAVAKVWKTNLDGEPTVFVHPVLVDIETNSSNYCYADENLINTYTTIWATEDAATIIEAIISFGTSSGRIVLNELAGKVFNIWGITDPATLFAILAEAAISWPGAPYEDLSLDDMEKNVENMEAFNELRQALEEEFG